MTIKRFIYFILTIVVLFILPNRTEASSRILFADCAAATRNNIYYAVGENGGDLYRFNCTTRDSIVLLSGNFSCLNFYDNTIFCQEDSFENGEKSSQICRVSYEGGPKETLAEGSSPVYMDKRIYYVSPVDAASGQGLCSMNLDGTDKRLLVQSEDIILIARKSSRIYMLHPGKVWNSYNTETGEVKESNITAPGTNVSQKDFPKFTVTSEDQYFSFEGSEIQIEKDEKIKSFTVGNEVVEKIVLCGGYLFVVTHGSDDAERHAAFIMTTSGRRIKAAGMW